MLFFLNVLLILDLQNTCVIPIAIGTIFNFVNFVLIIQNLQN